MKSKLITILLILSFSLSMCLSGCSKGEALDPEPTPTPSIEVTPMITPEVTPEPIPSEVVEPTPSAVLPDWEEPPVPTVYNEEADLNDDGHIEKSEWQSWVDQHPEDLDQDLIITDAEQKAYDDSQKPSTGGSTGGGTTGGNTGGNSGNTTNTPPPVQTQKPSTPPPVQTPSAEDETFGGSTDDITKWMQEHGGTKTEEEKEAFDEAAQKGFDPLE